MSEHSALHQAIHERYDAVTERIVVAGRTFSILRVRDTNTLLDSIDPAAFAQDERLPYWAEVWSSSVVLASTCLQDFDLRGARVLELGCGLGLAGIAAARAGAAVTLTDYEQDALLFARFNSITNLPDAGPGASCVSRLLDWRAPDGLETYDVILGADIIYEERNHLPLLALLEQCLPPEGFALFTDPDRRTAPGFTRLAASRGFTLQEERARVSHHGRDVTVNCFALRLPRSSPGKGRES